MVGLMGIGRVLMVDGMVVCWMFGVVKTQCKLKDVNIKIEMKGNGLCCCDIQVLGWVRF